MILLGTLLLATHVVPCKYCNVQLTVGALANPEECVEYTFNPLALIMQE